MEFEKELKATLRDAGFKHIKYRAVPESFWGAEKMRLSVAKEEKVAFQLILNYNHVECQYTLEKRDSVSWKGLIDRVRLDLKTDGQLENCFEMKFLGYVRDDDGTVVSDPILEDTEVMVEKGISQAIWIEGKVPKGCTLEESELRIDIFSRVGYEDEQKVKTVNVKLNISDIAMDEIAKSNEFYLDLWQHPSNWARTYHVALWSDRHFEIIEHNLRELASMGNKVVTAIVSDFPWAGQKCYEEDKNPSNLFEYSMVKVRKKISGIFECDFGPLDRYIELALSLGIDREVDIFGLMGVWDRGFGNPIEDYSDAIKISYYDETTDTFKYIKRKADLAEYIVQLFDHIECCGWWDKIKIMSDHPVEDKVLIDSRNFIQSLGGGRKVEFKSAVYSEDVIKKHGSKLDDASVSFALSIKMGSELERLKRQIDLKDGKLTWYVCWFPEKPNNFISSPLLENRLMGWYTYYLNLDGFLRWDYAIWPSDPWREPSYKLPYWKAGDMFFVYPGADLRPVRTQRWENLRFGIQDFQLLKALENAGYSRLEVESEIIVPLLGSKDGLKAVSERSVDIWYDPEYSAYEKVKATILERLVSDEYVKVRYGDK